MRKEFYCLLLKKAVYIMLSLTGTCICNAQSITTIAGSGIAGYSGDGQAANSAILNDPTGIVITNNHTFYITDRSNHVLRKIDSTLVITTIAGNGENGYGGDGGNAVNAQLNFPYRIVVDKKGNLFFSDQQNSVVRKINTSGIITTIAGIGTKGFSGDGSLATEAQLNNPLGIAVDTIGNIFIADAFNQRIRKIDTSGMITTIAGSGAIGSYNGGYSGDNGSAIAARLNVPSGIAIGVDGSIFITEQFNSVIRKISPAGIISTVAGTGNEGYSGDNGFATEAQLNSPSDIVVDNNGTIYFTDESNYRIRKIDTTGVITTIAGNGSQGTSISNASQATQVALGNPNGLCIDESGHLYFTDNSNNIIRKLNL